MKNISMLTIVALLSCGALSYGVVGYDNTGLEKGQMHIMGGSDELRTRNSGNSGEMHALPVHDEVHTMDGTMSHTGEVNTQDRYPYSQPGYLDNNMGSDAVENNMYQTGEMHNGSHRMVRPGPTDSSHVGEMNALRR